MKESIIIPENKDNFDIIRKFLKEHFLDAHHENIIIGELTEKDFNLIKKLERDILTEQEIDDRLEDLKNNRNSSSYHFVAMLKNKLISKDTFKKYKK